MQLVRRNARIGVSGVVIVLFCIVAFVGSLFYLTFNGPWGSNTLFPIQQTSYSDLPISTEKNDNQITIDDAIKDLKKEKCTIVYYNNTDLSLATRLQYTEFKEKAVKKGLIFIVPNEIDDVILMVRDKQGQWIWSNN